MMARFTNHNQRQQRLACLTASLLVVVNTLLFTSAPQTEAFTAPVAKPSQAAPQSWQPQRHPWENDHQKSAPKLHLFGNNQNDNDDTNKQGTDWHKVAETSGRIARQVGDKVLGALEAGSSKLVDLVSQGAEKVKDAFQEGYDSENKKDQERAANKQTNDNNNYSVNNDTYDEDLFRGIFMEEQRQVRMPDGRTRSTYWTATTFEQEASDTEDNEAVSDAFIRNQFMADDSRFFGARHDSVVDAISREDYATIEEVDDGGIEVEVMEGIRRPTIGSRNKVVDVEILDKTFM